MDHNILGLIISVFYIFSVLFISSILGKTELIGNEGSRKLIHIGVSNWWIIAMIYFNSWIYASILPAIFIVLNYLSYRNNLITAMERNGDNSDLGTVYFPVSFLVLTLITFSSVSKPYVGALGVLIMGYGDGLAAVIGEKYGKYKFSILKNEKSLEGSLTMFFASMIVAMILLQIYSPELFILKAVFLAALAALTEAFSPFGIDNLTVPLLVSFTFQLIFLR